jgi:hypothetical protein
MATVSLGRRPGKQEHPTKYHRTPRQLARDLLLTVGEVRHELAEIDGLLGDLVRQARRVARFGGNRRASPPTR